MTTAGTAVAPRRSWVQHVMGMPVSVLVRGPQARGPEAQEAVSRVYAELRRVDVVFSTWRQDSQVSRLIRGDVRPEQCSSEVQEVLDLCEQARQRTGGWFDHELPDVSGTRRLDPTGLVKGWAAQRAANHLRHVAGHDWLVNAGGDVVVHGRAQPFRIGIQHPSDAAAVLDVVRVQHGGVATSGSYARGAHVRDPRTGRPAAALLSATVVGPSLLWADVLATAAFAEGPESLRRLESSADHEAMLVLPNSAVLRTSGWPSAR